MAKVSIGLRGWRFDEDEVFDANGDFRPLDALDPDARLRLSRLVAVYDRPCDACWLIHGDEDLRRCNQAEVVYGEPFAEVLLCGEHEADFYYWYAEAGGERHRGTEAFQDRFHEWFAAGGRAPAGYGGVEHVETAPADVPKPAVPDLEDLNVELPQEQQARLDLREISASGDAEADETGNADGASSGEELDLDDVDLDADYPS